MKNIIEVNNLKTSFFTPAGEVKAVNGVSFKLKKGEVLGIVGESGSGKSITVLSILKLLGGTGKIINGEIILDGENIVDKDNKYMSTIRGSKIGMIFQDPMTSLNPVFKIGYQLREPIMKHLKLSKSEANKKAVEMLTLVGIPDAEKRMNCFPHEFSGGMRQRVIIAMALACNPELIIADEPTTALDVTIQAQIMELMKKFQKDFNTSIILITHDLGVVADLADNIIVMYSGSIMERGPVEDIFYNPKHPYTKGLLNSVPNPDEIIKKRLIPIDGQPPNLLNPPKGCPFSPRCPHAMKICLVKKPETVCVNENHQNSCWLMNKDMRKG
ncbi:oligopeptide transport ATP-binding protein OppD [Clostridium pasteurianum DSM 525 = ATCC 6013]|uniref:Oligopeptide transport ATP-binding protein OppD n=1 Tax=Clostridium pasteurianum DSM 525 = ATCC 6013 TaxID=1262449 RepID=A0A0H3J2Y3_CLOPA|nr:ABC transporter ATP-binding protein [Clostridium pasteurianum]AJA47152.1 oligopeptide transport ATP-binding protein OppD [Clostridium pasteurianum DSM 525 = ATCC 6013]AJA51140.1 oligopeptide transport ATP-binding protein OppD [Clostridium pasteurianum DSM 525 = ATCC 6013]AOZ74511.1 peptide ABC transporter ATP-binding protein [Clostridium pasteurianum DSM 525 = ATCC 6013]AOZ78308.1 peptide ABC transporter ATP-binding protein [Clostridium pasteurianum]ELP59461.1 Oligopeptide ABC transporter, 